MLSFLVPSSLLVGFYKLNPEHKKIEIQILDQIYACGFRILYTEVRFSIYFSFVFDFFFFIFRNNLIDACQNSSRN